MVCGLLGAHHGLARCGAGVTFWFWRGVRGIGARIGFGVDGRFLGVVMEGDGVVCAGLGTTHECILPWTWALGIWVPTTVCRHLLLGAVGTWETDGRESAVSCTRVCPVIWGLWGSVHSVSTGMREDVPSF